MYFLISVQVKQSGQVCKSSHLLFENGRSDLESRNWTFWPRFCFGNDISVQTSVCIGFRDLLDCGQLLRQQCHVALSSKVWIYWPLAQPTPLQPDRASSYCYHFKLNIRSSLRYGNPCNPEAILWNCSKRSRCHLTSSVFAAVRLRNGWRACTRVWSTPPKCFGLAFCHSAHSLRLYIETSQR